MKTTIVILISLILFTACKTDGNTNNSNKDISSETNSNQINSKDVRNCFEKFDYQLSEIYTKEDALKYFEPSQHADVKTDERKGLEANNYVSYKYKSERTHHVKAGNNSVEVPDFNYIEFSGLQFSKSDENQTLEQFERKYKQLSEQEILEIQSKMEKAYADKPKEELEQAKKFVETRKNLNYVPVQGLGTAAYWGELRSNGNSFGAELFVLVGTVEFSVKAKLDSDNMLNSQTAIAVAKEIIEKCN